MAGNLGTKHRCQSCGALFYDLNKTPITCPKCHFVQAIQKESSTIQHQETFISEEPGLKNENDYFEDTSELDSGEDLRHLSERGVESIESAQ